MNKPNEESDLKVKLREGTYLYWDANEAHGRVVDVDQVFVKWRHSSGLHFDITVLREEGEVVAVTCGKENHSGLNCLAIMKKK